MNWDAIDALGEILGAPAVVSLGLWRDLNSPEH